MGNVPTSDPDVIVEFHKKLISKLLEFGEVATALSGEPDWIGIFIDNPYVPLRLYIDGANTHLELVDPGDNSVDDPKISMNWKTALKFWFGDLDMMSALLTGAVKVQGQNMDPLFRLKSIVPYAREASREVARELGWD